MNVRDMMPWSRSHTPVPVAREPMLEPFRSLEREMNRVFDEIWRDFGPPAQRFGNGWGWPSVDVVEEDKVIRVTADLPGLNEQDIEVTLINGVLRLRGEKKAETEETSGRFYVKERSYGTFERAIPLNVAVEEDKIEASFKNGVLTIVLPKAAEALEHTKKIEITKQ